MTDSHNDQNDAAWLRSAFRQYEQPLVRYATRLLGNVDSAREVVQDAFLTLCRQKRETIRTSVKQWLFTVCRNRAFDVLKKESRMKGLSDNSAVSIQSNDSDHTKSVEAQEAAGEATAILNQLPTNQQEVIRLKLQDGFSYQQISEVTGLSVSNVGFLLHRGVKTIREQLRRCEGPDGC